MNYEQFIKELVKPLVVHCDTVTTEVLSQEDKKYQINVKVDASDLGRVIGHKGRIANSIRTIVHAIAAKNGEGVDISFAELQ